MNFSFFLFSLALLLNFVHPETLQCEFSKAGWGFPGFGSIYRCKIIHLRIMRCDVTIRHVTAKDNDAIDLCGATRTPRSFSASDDDIDEHMCFKYDSTDDDEEITTKSDDFNTLHFTTEDNGTEHERNLDECEKVLALEGMDLNMRYIPDGLGHFFVKIKGIHVTSSGLQMIQKRNLEQFPGLTYLNLADNELEFLPGDLFKNHPKLRFAGFFRNRLIYVGLEIFSNHEYLEELQFKGNVCTQIDCKNSTQITNVKKDLMKYCFAPTDPSSILYGDFDKSSILRMVFMELKEKNIESCEKHNSQIFRKGSVTENYIFKLFFGNW